VLCFFCVVYNGVDAKSSDEKKLEKFRQWAHEKLSEVANELSKKGIPVTEHYRSSSSGGERTEGKLRIHRSTEDQLEPRRVGTEGKEEKKKMNVELQYWAKKKTSLRRHALEGEGEGPVGEFPRVNIDAKVPGSDVQTGAGKPPTMVELPVDSESTQRERAVSGARGRALSGATDMYNETVTENAMMGDDNEPFHIPHHETEACYTPRPRPYIAKRKPDEEGLIAHAIREIVKPILPKDGGVVDDIHHRRSHY